MLITVLEIGHNLGCLHDRGTHDACDSSNSNFGYREPSARFSTIMAYPCKAGQCDNNAGGGCDRVQRFSNPDLSITLNDTIYTLGDTYTNCAEQINSVRAEVAKYSALLDSWNQIGLAIEGENPGDKSGRSISSEISASHRSRRAERSRLADLLGACQKVIECLYIILPS